MTDPILPCVKKGDLHRTLRRVLKIRSDYLSIPSLHSNPVILIHCQFEQNVTLTTVIQASDCYVDPEMTDPIVQRLVKWGLA